jgi:hypothetical protein
MDESLIRIGLGNQCHRRSLLSGRGPTRCVFVKTPSAPEIARFAVATTWRENLDGVRGALKFVNRVGELAEEQGHHPDISFAWGKVDITTWTHKINGLTESDFILAAKIDQLPKA